jgi:hypothetical protein
VSAMRIKISKLSDNKTTYRTSIDDLDTMPDWPEVGRPLLLVSRKCAGKGILTSNVVSVISSGERLIVRTANSLYDIRLESLEEKTVEQ